MDLETQSEEKSHIDDLVIALDGHLPERHEENKHLPHESSGFRPFYEELKANVGLESICYFACVLGEFAGELISVATDTSPQVLGAITGPLAGFLYGVHHEKQHEKKLTRSDLVKTVAINESACITTGTAVEVAAGAYANAAVLSFENIKYHFLGASAGFPLALAAMSGMTLFRKRNGPSFIVPEDAVPEIYERTQKAITQLQILGMEDGINILGRKYHLFVKSKPLTNTQREQYDENQTRLITISKAFRYIPTLKDTTHHVFKEIMTGIPHHSIDDHTH